MTLTVAEAAELLRCGRSRVFELLAEGRLVRAPKFGRHTVITRESVEALLAPADPPPAKRRRAPRSARQLADLIRAG